MTCRYISEQCQWHSPKWHRYSARDVLLTTVPFHEKYIFSIQFCFISARNAPNLPAPRICASTASISKFTENKTRRINDAVVPTYLHTDITRNLSHLQCKTTILKLSFWFSTTSTISLTSFSDYDLRYEPSWSLLQSLIVPFLLGHLYLS